MSVKPLFPTRSIYAFGIVLLGICGLAFFWFILNVAFVPIADVGHQMMQDLGTNSTATDNVEVFFGNVSIYILIFLLMVLGLWALVYTQRKGVLVREI